MMTEQEYIYKECEDHFRRIGEIEKAPIADRKAAKAEWKDALTDPALITERIEWLLAGHYGKGSHMIACQILAMNKRANKVAGLAQMIAALEWSCPAKMARDAWKELTTAQQSAVNDAIKAVIESQEKDNEI